MPALENARHERFAQELAKGKSQTDAYADAGYRGDVTAASRLSRNVKVQARVTELKERAATRAEISVAQITERLLNIADVAERTGVEVNGESGVAIKSSSKHLGVARAALMDVAKLNGLVVEKQEHSGQVNVIAQDLDDRI